MQTKLYRLQWIRLTRDGFLQMVTFPSSVLLVLKCLKTCVWPLGMLHDVENDDDENDFISDESDADTEN